jgi:hypothetical protein
MLTRDYGEVEFVCFFLVLGLSAAFASAPLDNAHETAARVLL